MITALMGLGMVVFVLAVALWLWMMADGKKETLARAERERLALHERKAKEDAKGK